jgi:hypothetical protein
MVCAALLLSLIPASSASLAQVSGSVVVNEVMTSNLSGIQDEYEPGLDNCRKRDCDFYYEEHSKIPFATYDGNYPDWIELYNPSDTAVNLSGFGLSDNASRPFKWVFPEYTIPPKGYFVVFATGRDRKPIITTPPGSEQLVYPHTNFKLTSSGETVVLTGPTGTTLDVLEVLPLPPDFSYGRQPDGAGTLHTFHTATPMLANTTSPFPGFIDGPLSMGPAGGFHTGSVMVELIGPLPDAEIYYTLDGEEPTPDSEPYAGPFTITGSTAVRARAYRDGIVSSRMVTQTYFLNYETTLPVVSITTAPDNLWSGDTGIYVAGNYGTGAYSNLWKDWERQCHVELYEVDGTVGISQEAGVKLHGRSTRENDRKGLALFARNRYGNDSFDYPVIPDLPQRKYASFVIRGGGDDWNKALIRDLLGGYLVRGLNIDFKDGRPAVLFLNGEYWGIHNIREKLNEEYLVAHHNVDPDNIDLVELYHGFKIKEPPVVLEGTADNYRAMVDFLERNDLNDPAVYEQVKAIIDIDSYIDHHVAGVYNANLSWLGNNYKCWRDRGPGGLWRWMYYDVDHAYNDIPDNYVTDMIEFLTNPEGPRSSYPPWTNVIIRRLFTSDEFRHDFINRAADFLNTVFTTERVIAVTDELHAAYEPEMPRHIGLWSSAGPSSMAEWEVHIESIRDFARKRTPYVREHIIDHWNLGGTSEVTLDVSDPVGGTVTISTVKPDAYPWHGMYFQDVPVQITAIPNPGYAFAGWDGVEALAKPAAWDAILTTTLPDSLNLTAVFSPASDAMNTVVITEINHDSAPSFNPGDWVELYNGYGTPLDVSGWRLRDDDDSRSYVLPLHTVIDPGEYLVVAREVTTFTGMFPGVTTVVGGFAFGFSGNDAVRLFDAADELVDVVLYDTGLYWPSGADGTGSTLSLRDLTLDNSQPDSWVAARPHGTPGAPNTVTDEVSIIINEISYNPPVELPSEDWVELYNTGTETVDLAGWVLRDDSDANTFILPSGTTIGPEGYLVLCRDAAAFAAVFPAAGNVTGDFIFGLANSGDMVRLFDSGGALVDVVLYDDEYPWPVAPDGDGMSLSLRNPLSDNSYFAHWEASTGHGTPGERNDIHTVRIADDAGLAPTVFALGGNYPNPFNGATAIPFSLPRYEHVTVTVHSLVGQRVATLIDTRLEPGNHVAMFHPEGLASGVYLVHMNAGSFRAGRRMVFIK